MASSTVMGLNANRFTRTTRGSEASVSGSSAAASTDTAAARAALAPSCSLRLMRVLNLRTWRAMRSTAESMDTYMSSVRPTPRSSRLPPGTATSAMCCSRSVDSTTSARMGRLSSKYFCSLPSRRSACSRSACVTATFLPETLTFMVPVSCMALAPSGLLTTDYNHMTGKFPRRKCQLSPLCIVSVAARGNPALTDCTNVKRTGCRKTRSNPAFCFATTFEKRRHPGPKPAAAGASRSAKESAVHWSNNCDKRRGALMQPQPQRPFHVESNALLTAEDIARRTGLRPAQVRFYAETYGEMAGLLRARDGGWLAAEAHLPLFQALAAGRSLAEGLLAVTAPTALAAAAADPSVPAVAKPPADDPESPGPPGPADALGSADALGPADTAGSSAGLAARIEDLALHLEDLSEETKQVQLLLARIISILDITRRPLLPGVTPWEPPDLSPAGRGASRPQPA